MNVADPTWSVYFVMDGHQRRSYIGATNHWPRRLRQHRGELRGGARATATFAAGVHYVMRLSGFPTSRSALSYEWHAKRRHLRCHALALPWLVPPHPRVVTFLAPRTLPQFRDLPLTWHVTPWIVAADRNAAGSAYRLPVHEDLAEPPAVATVVQ